MTTAVRDPLVSFDRLPEPERREAATEILRRAAQLDSSPLDDEELALAAGELFLELDAREVDV
jgi:hypothetical protein